MVHAVSWAVTLVPFDCAQTLCLRFELSHAPANLMPRLMARLGGQAVDVWGNGGLYSQRLANQTACSRAIVRLQQQPEHGGDPAVQVRNKRYRIAVSCAAAHHRRMVGLQLVGADYGNRIVAVRVCIPAAVIPGGRAGSCHATPPSEDCTCVVPSMH